MAKGKYQEWLTPEGQALLESWARRGLTMERIAGLIGVNRKTLREWMASYPPICTAIKKSREMAVAQAEKELEAMGRPMTLTDTVTEEVYDADGNLKSRIVKTTQRQVAPNVASIIFRLTNLDPAHWQNRPNTPPETPREIGDDGFIAAMAGHGKEAFADGTDEPRNAED